MVAPQDYVDHGPLRDGSHRRLGRPGIRGHCAGDRGTTAGVGGITARDIAAWLLVGFGVAYATWGTVRALRNKPHTHRHVHSFGLVHSHAHSHKADHMHPHGADGRSLTPWILFTIFVFGPCEPLIPLLMYPAAALSPGAIALVAAVFGAVTIATMLAVVFLLVLGLTSVSTERLGRLSHPLAGVTIFLCGIAIFLGL